MENIAHSLASLVKFNGGMFKSEKQSAFILSQLFEGNCWQFHKTYNNTSKTVYSCDNEGVTRVTKINTVKGSEVQTIVWDRFDASFAAVQQAKADKKAAKAKEQAEINNANQARFEAYNAECNKYTKSINNFGKMIAARLLKVDPSATLASEYLADKTAFDLAGDPVAAKLIARQKKIDAKLIEMFYN